MTKNIFQIAIFSVLLFKIIIIASLTTITTFCKFYKFSQPQFVTKLDTSLIADNQFYCYSGFDTGYGFFSPNVSSNFIILISDGTKTYSSDDLMNTNEGKQRFLGVNDIFLKNLDEKRNEDIVEANKVILKKINQAFEKKYNSKFKTSAYLYDYPKLKDFKTKKLSLIKFEETR